MNKKRNNLGFTLAELLIVVAIITVLGGVSFIAVQNYQRDMALLERDAIAKEIFIAAQNHLTMADSQGYMGVEMDKPEYETTIKRSEETIKVYVAAYGGTMTDPLDVMLPFGAIDETVRAGGRYAIRYQTNPARVLDVFYWTPGTSRFDGTASYDANMLALGAESARNNRKNNKPIIGWYGGEGVEAGGEYRIVAPKLEVVNAETLYVKITDTNSDYTDTETAKALARMKLIIKGVTSNAMLSVSLNSSDINARLEYDNVNKVYTYVLDDITKADMHFADLASETDSPFLPGEDIVVQAVAYSNERLSNIAYSAEYTTNSLFGDLEEVKTTGEDGTETVTHTAMIGNMRHLENLDPSVSNLDNLKGEDSTQPKNVLKIAAARQLVDLAAPADPDDTDAKDLSWAGFKTATGGTKVFEYKDTAGAESFHPVTPGYALDYQGQGHSVEGISVNVTGDAGLFGALSEDSSVSDLALIDFNIVGKNAGALAGSMTGADVTNVVAYNTAAYNTAAGLTATVAGTGDVGGLIGTMSGGSVEKSAAALVVRSTGGNAGGLIGSASDSATVTASYAGGHTNKGAYYNDNKTPIYNVTAAESAGGLIGSAGDTAINYSYSTCSAIGATAGGLAGTAAGNIEKCYAAGLVSASTEDGKQGAFAGTYSGTATGCLYYEIVNEALKAVDDDAAREGITALDADVTSYNAFVGKPADWQTAAAYDKAALDKLFGTDKYSLQTVSQLGATLKASDDDTTDYFVSVHHGDWPAPETLIIND